VLALYGQHAFALVTAIAFPVPSSALAYPASSWRALAFSAGGDGGRRGPEHRDVGRPGQPFQLCDQNGRRRLFCKRS
jgi:hypothetical protein